MQHIDYFKHQIVLKGLYLEKNCKYVIESANKHNKAVLGSGILELHSIFVTTCVFWITFAVFWNPFDYFELQ